MHLQTLAVEGYRGFKSQAPVSFGVPDGNAGSGLTILTGPNNGGKTALLELVQALGRGATEFGRSHRNSNTDFTEVSYTLTEGGEFVLRSDARGAFSASWHNESGTSESPLVDRVYVVPTSRTLTPFFGDSTTTRQNYTRQSVQQRSHRNDLTEPIGLLMSIARDRDLKAQFDADVTRILGFDLAWELDKLENGNYVFSIDSPTGSHTSDGLGYGIGSVFYLVAGLTEIAGTSVVCIDEPEISLHPQVQRGLVDYIAQKSAHAQIVLATHSPYLIDPGLVGAGAELVRVAVEGDTSIARQIQPGTRDLLSKLAADLNNPHVLGLEAREVFFVSGGRRVVVTEGQEDVVLLKKHLAANATGHDPEFFGWGAGGAEKVRLVMQIFRDLGIPDVATLLDGDKEHVHTQLSRDFPEFTHVLLPAGDIRDKKARGAVDAKEGLFTSAGEVKPGKEEVVHKVLQDLAG